MSEQMRSIESVFIGGMVSCISSWSLAWNTMLLMSDGLVLMGWSVLWKWLVGSGDRQVHCLKGADLM